MPLVAATVSPLLCALGAAQVLCLLAAGAARFTEGTPHERGGQWLCLAALTVVGALCGAAIQFGPDAAAACAGTLAIMTLVTVSDFSPRG